MVTIGIPVFNEERYVESAIRSAASQADRVLISDNASSDKSQAICKRVAAEYENVEFVAHTTNIGAHANFGYLLDSADTPYFMWLGAHDLISDDYISATKLTLDEYPDAYLAYSVADHINLETGARIFLADFRAIRGYLESGYIERRAYGIARYLEDCSIIHGVWRTDGLRDAWVDDAFLANDHVILMNAAVRGRIMMARGGVYYRGHPRMADTKAQQLQRITGNTLITDVSYRPLAVESCLIVRRFVSSWVWRVRIRMALVRRFGPVTSGHIVGLVFDNIAYSVFRGELFFRKVAKKIIKMLGYSRRSGIRKS